jgi:transposase
MRDRTEPSFIPTETEEDMREPGWEREALVTARLKTENQIGSQLIRFRIADFRPRLKKATQKLEELRTFDGRPLPPKSIEKLRRLMAQHRLLSEQMKEIEEARQQVVMVRHPDHLEKMIRCWCASSDWGWRRRHYSSTRYSLVNSVIEEHLPPSSA